MSQLDPKRLAAAVEAVVSVLAPLCSTREEALQVLMHVTAAALEGRDEAFVTGYLVKITHMLDGHFDRRRATD